MHKWTDGQMDRWIDIVTFHWQKEEENNRLFQGLPDFVPLRHCHGNCKLDLESEVSFISLDSEST